MDPIELTVNTIFATIRAKLNSGGHTIIADALTKVESIVDADLLPVIEQALKDKGISISI